MTGGAIRAPPVYPLINYPTGERPRIAAGAIGVAMQSTEAMQDEKLIGRISMRVEHAVGRCDDARRSLRADALARWLIEEWRASRSASKEAAA